MNPQTDTPESAEAMTERLFFSFDVESIGLHGEGYSVGWCVMASTGAVFEESYLACLPGAANGSASDREWVAKNIPDIPITHNTPKAVRDAFWDVWMLWKKNGAIMVGDCPWPVEARFLNKCIEDSPSRNWEGPYPLIDVGSVVLASGGDPTGTFERTVDELPKHHPAKDARQSARVLVEAARRLRQQSDTALKLQRCEEVSSAALAALSEASSLVAFLMGAFTPHMHRCDRDRCTLFLKQARAALPRGTSLAHPTRNEGEKKV